MASLAEAGERAAARPNVRAVANYAFVALAWLALAVPGLIGLAQTVWTTDQGAQGPIILGTGLWLLVREAVPILKDRRAAGTAGQRGRGVVLVPWLIASFLAYIFAGMVGIVWLLWAATYSVFVAILYAYIGLATLKKLWFPLFYLMFLIPPPYGIMLALTRALKLWIGEAAVGILATLGYQVAISGTTLYIDQYELLVAAACSGMNSLTSLLAIGLFYIFLRHRSDWRYSAMLAALVIPIAIAANLIRVILLLLITKYMGNEVAQGMLHEAAGLTMFVAALLLLITVDALLDPVRRRLGWGEAA